NKAARFLRSGEYHHCFDLASFASCTYVPTTKSVWLFDITLSAACGKTIYFPFQRQKPRFVLHICFQASRTRAHLCREK
ncbi:hypothetical protein, partial [Kosakonia sp. BK9b]